MESTVAGLLRGARIDAGLTQLALAEAAGITQSNISAYESGRRSPTVRTLEALLWACGYRLQVQPID